MTRTIAHKESYGRFLKANLSWTPQKSNSNDIKKFYIYTFCS